MRCKLRAHLIFAVSAVLLLASSVRAQTAPDPLNAQGIVPWGSFQHGGVDSVNTLNGSITLRIPLFSLPQRGRLSLSFSLYGTTTVWTTTHTCNSQPSLSAPCYTVRSLNQFIPVGPQLIIDQYLSTLITQYRYPANSNTFYNIFSLTDATGASHPLGYDNSNLALLRATDGSGFLYAPATATPDSPFFPSGGYDGTIYDVAGIQETITNASSFLPTTTFKDSDGNSIILNYTGSSIATSQVTDSLGRVFPGIPNWNSQHTSSIAGCPSVSANFQSTTSSINWTVPGPNGGQQTFLFCYASVFYRTNLVAPTCTYGTSECVQTSGTVPALQSIVLPNGTYWAFTYDAANPSDNTSFGYAQVTQVRLPTGGTITYQYQNFMKSCAPLNGTPNFSRSVVSRTFTPLIGTPTTWNYNFNSYPINTATDPLGNDTVYTFTALGTGCDLHETKQQIYQGAQSAGKVLQTRATAYQFAATNPQSGVFNGGAGTNTAVLPTTVTTTLDNNQATTTTTQYNDGGFTDVQPACTAGANNTFSCTYSATQQMPLGLVTSTSTTDYGGSTLKTIQTQYLFQQNSSYRAANFLNQIASTTILNGSGTQVAKTTYGYDENNGSPQGIFAHKTSVNRWLNTTGANITSKTVYNTQGMPSQSIDPVGNATRYSYDTTGAFVTQIQKPDTTLNGITTHHVTNYTYDTVSGKPLTLTDENSNQTSYAYDNMARLISTTYPSPDGGQTTTCYTDSGGATCAQTAAPFQIIITDKLSASQNKITTTYVDGLGRVTQTLLNSDPDGATYSGVTIYDGLDRPSTVYNPTRCNPPTTNCGESTWGTNSNQYDALGRITQVTNPNGSTVLTTYTGRAAQISDEGNGTKRVQRITQSDALGRLTSVCEVTSTTLTGITPTPAACGQDISATGFLTTYQYDALNNLLQVNQGGLNTRTFTYDSLSRMTNASNPEAGTIAYTYDLNSNLQTKTDARGAKITFAYDPLNRLTSKTYSDGTPTATFNYDEASALGGALTNTKGRKSSQSTASPNPTSEAFSYNQLGRVKANAQCTPLNNCATIWTPTYTYDLIGDSLTLNNSSGTTFTYAYSSALRLTSLSSSQNDANHPGTLFSAAHYSPAGALTSAMLGNGLTETRAYDSLLRLTSISNGSVYNLTIPSGGYAPNSNIVSANDSANGNWTYAYDDFNRLSSANATGQAYTYGYDRFGNRWSQNGPHTSSLGFDANNHVVPGSGITYDAAGNVTNDGTTAYTYDAEERITSATNSSRGLTCYIYNADGQRVRKTYSTTGSCAAPTSSSTNDYIYDLDGHIITIAGIRNEIFMADRHLATYVFSSTYFHHADWLATVRVRSSASGASYDTCTSLPFGDWLTCSGGSDPSPNHFTGKQHDFESGIDDFEARYLASTMGRFMSPDPENAGASDENPQSWNAYVYVLDDPLNSTDPDGRTDCPDKDPYKCTVRADPPPQLPTSAAKIAQVWENAGKSAQTMVDAARVWLNTTPNSGCVAAATATGTVAGAYFLGKAGTGLGAAVGGTGGTFALPGGGTIGGAVLGGAVGGTAGTIAGAGLGGAGGWLVGQVACRTGGAGGAGGGSGSGKQIPGNPFKGKDAAQDAFKHLQRFHGVDPAVASERLHRIKQAAGLGPADNAIIGRTGDVYNPFTGEWIGSLTTSH